VGIFDEEIAISRVAQGVAPIIVMPDVNGGHPALFAAACDFSGDEYPSTAGGNGKLFFGSPAEVAATERTFDPLVRRGRRGSQPACGGNPPIPSVPAERERVRTPMPRACPPRITVASDDE
jgi:hypothetical protein